MTKGKITSCQDSDSEFPGCRGGVEDHFDHVVEVLL